jgi:hypothetical protein
MSSLTGGRRQDTRGTFSLQLEEALAAPCAVDIEAYEERSAYPLMTLFTSHDADRHLLVHRPRTSFFDGSTWLLSHRHTLTSLSITGAILDWLALTLLRGMHDLRRVAFRDVYVVYRVQDHAHPRIDLFSLR